MPLLRLGPLARRLCERRRRQGVPAQSRERPPLHAATPARAGTGVRLLDALPRQRRQRRQLSPAAHFNRVTTGATMSRTAVTIETRLWPKIAKAGPDECWIWTASRNATGYGTIQAEGGLRPLLSHRVVYELTCGPIPAGMNVLHRCDNPACCNPDHLWLGSQIENIADMNIKGRNGHLGRPMTAEAIAKRKATCLRNDSHRKRWETRRKNNPDWLVVAQRTAAQARAALKRKGDAP